MSVVCNSTCTNGLAILILHTAWKESHIIKQYGEKYANTIVLGPALVFLAPACRAMEKVKRAGETPALRKADRVCTRCPLSRKFLPWGRKQDAGLKPGAIKASQNRRRDAAAPRKQIKR